MPTSYLPNSILKALRLDDFNEEADRQQLAFNPAPPEPTPEPAKPAPGPAFQLPSWQDIQFGAGQVAQNVTSAVQGAGEAVQEAAGAFKLPDWDSFKLGAEQAAEQVKQTVGTALPSWNEIAFPDAEGTVGPGSPSAPGQTAGAGGSPPSSAPAVGADFGELDEEQAANRAYARGAAQRSGIDPDIFERQMWQENRFRTAGGSPAGAQGVAQIMPQYHPGVDVTNPQASLDYAANLMKSHLETYGGDIRKALQAYNAGPGNVASGAADTFEETKDYLAKILGGVGEGVQSLLGRKPSESTPASTQTPYDIAFGYDQEYGGAQFNADIPRHRGVDLVVRGAENGGRGTPVKAFRDGVVVAITRDPNGGNGVILQNKDGLYDRYFHFDGINVKQGQQVTTADDIGILGASGTEGFPHVHFEVSKGLNGDPVGQTIDPRPYMAGGGHADTEPHDDGAPLLMASGDEGTAPSMTVASAGKPEPAPGLMPIPDKGIGLPAVQAMEPGDDSTFGPFDPPGYGATQPPVRDDDESEGRRQGPLLGPSEPPLYGPEEPPVLGPPEPPVYGPPEPPLYGPLKPADNRGLAGQISDEVWRRLQPGTDRGVTGQRDVQTVVDTVLGAREAREAEDKAVEIAMFARDNGYSSASDPDFQRDYPQKTAEYNNSFKTLVLSVGNTGGPNIARGVRVPDLLGNAPALPTPVKRVGEVVGGIRTASQELLQGRTGGAPVARVVDDVNLAGMSDTAPRIAEDQFGRYSVYGDAVDPGGNWKRLEAIPDDQSVVLYHATSRERAESILRNGYNAQGSAFTNTPADYVYLGNKDHLGTYQGLQGGSEPAFVAFKVPKGSLEPDAGTDWNTWARGNLADLRRQGINPRNPTAVNTFAEINQVRAHKSAAEPIGIIDARTGQFTPAEQIRGADPTLAAEADRLDSGRQAGRAPGLGVVAQESDRYYHGTGGAFDSPDPARFDENGLFGPGYYLTSDPRVAGSGDLGRPGYAEQGVKLNTYPNAYTMSEAELRAGLARAESDLANPQLPEHLRPFKEDMVRAFKDELSGGRQTSGPNVRAVDVPRGLRLLDVEQAPGKRALIEFASRLADDTGIPRVRSFADRMPGGFDSGEFGSSFRTYGDILQEFQSPQDAAAINRALVQQGYDGISYSGGKRIPMKADDGSPIEHAVTVIFPESLPKITNATSGRPGGLLPSASPIAQRLAGQAAGGAVAGGYAASQEEGADIGSVARGAAAGAVGGVARGAIGTRGSGQALARVVSRAGDEAEPGPRSVTGAEMNAAKAEVRSVPVAEVRVDPARFQFKFEAVRPETGTTTKLADVRRWNPEMGGALYGWEDEAGQVFVVNGHHRIELAQRLGARDVNMFVDRAADGVTAEQARVKGVLINIAEGNGTPLDVAKFLRDSGQGIEDLRSYGVSPRNRIATRGAALAALDDGLFQRVIVGQLPEDAGVVIGQNLPGDFANQRAVADIVQARPLKPNELQALIDEARGETVTMQQDTLFGMTEVEQSTLVERARLRADVQDSIAKDRRLFGFVARADRAAQLSRGENVINVEASAKIADESARAGEYFRALANAPGPVSDAIREGAESLVRGEKYGDVQRATLDRVRAAIADEASGSPRPAPARVAPAVPRTERPAAEPAATPEPAPAVEPPPQTGPGLFDEPAQTGPDLFGSEPLPGDAAPLPRALPTEIAPEAPVTTPEPATTAPQPAPIRPPPAPRTEQFPTEGATALQPEPVPVPRVSPSDRAAANARERILDARGKPITLSAPEEVARLRLDKFPEDVRADLEAAATDVHFARDQRRGVIPDDVANELADTYRQSAERWIREGRAGRSYNEEQTLALRNLSASTALNVHELTLEIDAAKAAGTTPDLLIAQRAAESNKLNGLVQVAEGARAEAGRTLRAWRMESRLLADNPQAAIERIYRKVGDRAEAEKIAEEYSKAVKDGDPFGAAKIQARVERGEIKTGERFALYRRFNMLSGPRTLEVNATSGLINMVGEDLAAVSGSLAKGDPRGAAIQLAAPWLGLQRAGRGFLQTFAHGITEEQALRGDVPRNLSSRATNRFDKAQLTVQELPDRFNSAVDQFWRGTAESLGLATHAVEQTRHLKGEARVEAIAKILSDPDKTAADAAERLANRVTFQGDLGALGRGLQRVQEVPYVGNLLMPFLRTVYHITTRSIDFSPLGLATTGQELLRSAPGISKVGQGAYAAGKPLPKGVPKLSDRIRDNVAGTLVFAGAYEMARQGGLTGAGPDDVQKREELRATGWRPYSIKIGDSYHSYANVAPLMVALSSAAAAHEAQKYGKPGAGVGDLLADGAARTVKVIGDMSIVSGIGAIVKAQQDPERYGTQWLTQFLQTLMPAGSAVNTVGQATDTVERRALPGSDTGTKITEGLKARVPGLREQVPASTDPLGEPIENQQRGVAALFPTRPSREQAAPIVRAFLETGVDIGSPPKKFTFDGNEVPLTPAEQRRYQEIRGDFLQRFAPKVLDRPAWAGWKPETKAQALQGVLDDMNTAAAAQLQKELGAAEIRRRLFEGRQKKAS